MRKTIIVALAASVLFTGCVSEPSVKKVSQMSSVELCKTYAALNYGSQSGKGKNIENELLRRREVSPAEWEIIKSKKVVRGMSLQAVVCMLGIPDSKNDSSYGDSQLVYYAPGGFTKGATYVYVNSDNIVTNWSTRR